MCLERLVYLLIGFAPNYDRDLAQEQIKGALKSQGVLAYTVWELFGREDILLRAWLPPNFDDMDKFKEALDSAISGPHRAYINSFQVEQILYHYLWQQKPDILTARREISADDLRNLNSEVQVPPKELQRYKAKGYISRLPSFKLLKFFTIVTPADERQNNKVRDGIEFRKALLGLLPTLSLIKSVAVYSGHGLGEYLISGRVSPGNFESLSTEMTENINRLGQRYVGVRTITWLSAFSEPLDQREQLGLPASVYGESILSVRPSLVDILADGEGARLEVKGSAFNDLKPHLVEGGALKENPAMTKIIAKAVIGLLNSGGGHVVVGVLETADFSFDQALGRFPTASLVGTDFIAIGVEPEFGRRSWDGYVSRLKGKLETEISPRPLSWLNFVRVDYDGIICCLISVEAPDEWFWAKDNTFYVRQINGTVPLTAPEQSRYQRAHPR